MAGGDDVLAAACDLPFLDAATVADAAGDRPRTAEPAVDVVVARTERIEPALAWWSASARDEITRHWDHGVRALHEVIAELRSVEVPVDPAALRNVNAPADLPP